jgi:tetratricopeptide (TPR) repeat protein
MLKQILPLLFTFIFSINLFAQPQDVNKELTDIKLQIQEIKLLDARDEREKKIEKLENKIDDLDSKFNQNNIDKKEIDGKIGTQDKLITEIGSNTNRISWIISLFGVLITIIVIYFVVKFEKMAEVLAEKELKKWIKNEAMGEFEPKIKEIKDLIKKAESEVSLFKEKAESTISRIEKKLFENKELTHEEENEIKSDIKDIENKQEKDYTFADWRKKTLLYFISNKYEEALKLVENMLIFSDDDLRSSETLFLKAIILNKLNKNIEAIEVYDELIERFKDSKEDSLLELLAKVLSNKAIVLGKMNIRLEEAIIVCNDVIRRFNESNNNKILLCLIKALVTKAVILGKIEQKVEKSIEIYDEVINRFGDLEDIDILEQVLLALQNKSSVLRNLDGKSEEAIIVYDEIVRRFGDSRDNRILEKVASALYNKGEILSKIPEKSEEAIIVYDEIVRRFGDSKDSSILEPVAKSLLNKGILLGEKDGKAENAIEVYTELVRRFKDSTDNSILGKVAKALSNKIETNFILGNENSKEDLDLCFSLSKENKEQLLKFEMLQILGKAKGSNQNSEIKEWQVKFKDTRLGDWSFDELKTWAKTLENDVKERILRYVDIFENHNKNIEGK